MLIILQDRNVNINSNMHNSRENSNLEYDKQNLPEVTSPHLSQRILPNNISNTCYTPNDKEHNKIDTSSEVEV